MRVRVCTAAMIVAAASWSGCVSVDKPLVEVRSGGPPVDSSRVPPTSTHDEARAELNRAYGRIQQLEQQNQKLSQDKDKMKRERDECRDRLERYEDD